MIGIVFYALTFLIYMAAFFPFWNSGSWFVRTFDFPRLQILVINLILLIVALFSTHLGLMTLVQYLLVLSLIGTLLLDLYRILPYTIFHPKESKTMSDETSLAEISILTANVLMTNKKHHKILGLIRIKKPDLVYLLEIDKKWEKASESLDEIYPYYIKLPQSNGYGKLIYSKYPLKNIQIKNLVDETVPSLFADIILNNNVNLHFVGLHPRPPRPNEGDSDQRDSELMIVAEYINKIKNSAVIVAGDLNDVAWSHTTRLFKRSSGTLDPRVGRGMFNTFHSNIIFLRFPLDHFFHTKKVMVCEINRLPHIGSDHFPLYAKFHIIKTAEINQQPVAPLAYDSTEREELKRRGDSWESPDDPKSSSV